MKWRDESPTREEILDRTIIGWAIQFVRLPGMTCDPAPDVCLIDPSHLVLFPGDEQVYTLDEMIRRICKWCPIRMG